MAELFAIPTILLGLVATVIPPMLAWRRTGTRGMWIGLIFVALFLGLIAMGLSPSASDPAFRGHPKEQIELLSWLFTMCASTAGAAAFGCFLAAFFYRRKSV